MSNLHLNTKLTVIVKAFDENGLERGFLRNKMLSFTDFACLKFFLSILMLIFSKN